MSLREELEVKDESKYQVLTLEVVNNGEVVTIPLPMPYLFDSEEIPKLTLKSIAFSKPLPLPDDAALAEIEAGAKNASKPVQEENA